MLAVVITRANERKSNTMSHDDFSLLEKIPTPIAASTSAATVTNGLHSWLEGASGIFGQLTTILGFPVAVCMLIYWFRKARKG